MDISYSLAIEDHGRINPLQGLEALAEKIVPAGATREKVPSKAEVKSQNEASMAALTGMLQGKVNNPLAKKRKPRRA